ncbi:hypothetical protein MKEN_01393600 [Mycena kentingensis (nom. inval.)]|nr:hypothetical protein MKEN_01393600 [Mycena kentingensis (nom. inval.)]
MKRAAAALVSYSSSDSEDEEQAELTKAPPPKKKKLPTLAQTLTGPVHIDDPSLHQGRTRTTPHVEGQWATHVYACVPLQRTSTLYKLLVGIIEAARKEVPTLHDFFDGKTKPELHISLSRPVYLRVHQRDEMKRAVKKIAENTQSFAASFAQITSLMNDDGTRIFLALEIGAGHHELAALTNDLAPALRAIRQQEYYAAPRFHASIAWALLGGGSGGVGAGAQLGAGPVLNTEQLRATGAQLAPQNENGFPSTLLPALNAEYGDRLTSSVALKSFAVEEIGVKIGKDVSLYGLL